MDVVSILLSLPALILALTVHEYAHARAAYEMGDPTARNAGRMTLEPWAHLDPIGTVLLVLYRFGWAKPVPINPRNFRDPRRGLLYSSLAGPLANLALAVVTVFVLYLGLDLFTRVAHLAQVLYYIFIVNIYFGFFNLIPVPPLDGSKVLMALLPGRQAYAFSRLEPYGPVILILFLLTGAASAIVGGLGDAFAGAVEKAARLLAALLGVGG